MSTLYAVAMSVPPERRLKGMVCARCDVWIQHRFVKDLADIAHIIHDGEYATLEAFEIELYCPVCGDKTITTGRNLVIDIPGQKILRCEIDPPPKGDMTPPDFPPES
jgi:hypothetical protein